MTDYLYSSARIRALENDLIGGERLERLLHLKTSSEICSALSEYGIFAGTEPDAETELRRTVLPARLRAAYDAVSEMLPDEEIVRIWKCPYDCNNTKAAIKCFFRGVDPEPMMFGFGSVDIGTIRGAVEKRDFSCLPGEMADAAREAMDAYSKTKNPQTVDLTLDAACYREMLSLARSCGVEFAVRLVRAKIDLTNLMTLIRIRRMKNGEAGKVFLSSALLDGGTFDASFFLSLYDGTEDALWEKIRYSDYAAFAELTEERGGGLTAIERSADDCWMRMVKEAKYIPYGPEVAAAYLIASEYEVRNLRILLAGKDAGLGAETIRERIRESYV